MNVRFAGFKNFSQGLMFLFVIFLIILVGTWVIISIIGNVVGMNNDKTPSIDKARYAFYLKATNEIVYTDAYENDGDGKYLLHGYYEYIDGKYKRHDNELPLDEYYWGTIKVVDRME